MISLKGFNWTKLSVVRNSDPKSLCTPTCKPRLARDETYAMDIIKAWKQDLSSQSTRSTFETFGCPFPYRDANNNEYYGYLVIPSTVDVDNISEKLPLVVLFHTGAGPQDIFNRFKADQIAREKCWGSKGCIIFIADILSDPNGWAWGDRDRYWQLKRSLNEFTTQDGMNCRWKMRSRILPALHAIESLNEADPTTIVAWGFCFGGQPVLELARMQYISVKGLISFHGIFNDAFAGGKEIAVDIQESRPVLICNGQGDPWVPASDLALAKNTFETCGWSCEVMNFAKVLHNFSNPRTQYDGSGFGYDKNASNQSWEAALKLIRNVFDL